MKQNTKAADGENPVWLRSTVITCSLSKLTISSLFLIISLPYLIYYLQFPYCNLRSPDSLTTISSNRRIQVENLTSVTLNLITPPPPRRRQKTSLRHIVFGIAASSGLWERRKEYIKLWYRPDQMRGVVWIDGGDGDDDEEMLPPIKISGDTARFAYKHAKGDRSAIRISRIVSETVRLGLKDVRWLVMGDDDTVFVAENLVGVLAKYDHEQYYYIGSNSESHLQNIMFSYAMAYGGGGFAISYPLAVALSRMQDRCLGRYPGLYGSDDRIQACMAEIGVPLTKEIGFHQFDVYGNAFGLLAAHPVTPLVSLHHIDVIEPIFPKATRLQSLQRLAIPMSLDPPALMQQSICYDHKRHWTISVSWGYAVQIIRGTVSPREMEMPVRTFVNWHKKADYSSRQPTSIFMHSSPFFFEQYTPVLSTETVSFFGLTNRGYAFNTRPVPRDHCRVPFVYTLTDAVYEPKTGKTASEYVRHRMDAPATKCNWKKFSDPEKIDRVEVYKTPDPDLWAKAPRRNCCRVLPSSNKKKKTVMIDVGECRENEVMEMR
ncbi:hypothetical protein LINGRAPRIM_LOCUS1860 [Linum grandiflorum]